MYKHFTNQLPQVFQNYFCTHNEIHNHYTRKKDSYKIPKIKTEFSYKTVKIMGPVKWNTLEKDVKSSKSVKMFRKELKYTFISNYV